MAYKGDVVQSEVLSARLFPAISFFNVRFFTLGPVRLLIAYVFTPSFLFFELGRYFYMIHPLVNADYIALGLISPWIPIPMLMGSYFVLLLNEMLVNIASMFNFSIGEFILSFRYMKFLNFHVIGKYGAMALVGAVAVSFAAVKVGNLKRNRLSIKGRMTSLAAGLKKLL